MIFYVFVFAFACFLCFLITFIMLKLCFYLLQTIRKLQNLNHFTNNS